MSSYLSGLRDTGWRGPAAEIRLGYAATSALRFGPGTVRLVLLALLDASRHDHAAEVLGMPFAAVLDHWAAVIRADTQLHAQARQLMT